MRRRKLLWHIFPSYLLITIVAVTAVSWYAYASLRGFHLAQTAAGLEARAHFLDERVRGLIAAGDVRALGGLADELGPRTSTRITIVAPGGRVLADSDEDAARMDNHADRPEIIEAMAGGAGASSRYSYTLERNMMYVAVPVFDGGDIIGIVRTAVPLTSVEDELRAVRGRIIVAAMLLSLVGAAVSLVVSRRIARPLEDMERGARRFAQGDFKHNVPVPRSTELASLAESMNRMAAELDMRIRTVTQQRAEQEGVFASMSEGVIAVDPGRRIITVNRAAAEMFGIDASEARGRVVHEAIRNTDLHRFATVALESEVPVEGEIRLEGEGETILQAHGAALRDEADRQVGAVIAFTDVTRIRRLENVRRDFVANVSHELRTPITAIKGFVETIRDGGHGNPEDTARFLGIVSKHVDRLDSIIEDLLYLSRIEEKVDQSRIVLSDGPVIDVLRAAIDARRSAAAERQIRIGLRCDESLRASVNPPLLEHAVVNLLDNAIKFSDPGGVVEIEAREEGDEVAVSVRDHGAGISPEHLPRIFERFYRVDKGRSREIGGTGLGLAIAKHIAQAHGGRIAVESTPGSGSAFTIHLPAADRA
jgi:two-component system phosphate regulon sensor histidine kinase PhoR